MNKFLLFLFLMCVGSQFAAAATPTPTPSPLPPTVSTEPIKRVAVLPTKCDPAVPGTILVLKTTDSTGLPKGRYTCTAVNTWARDINAADPSLTSKFYVDAFGSMGAALAAVGTINKATLVVSTPKAVTTSTVASNITLEFSNTGKLTVASGQTFTCNQCTITAASNQQIFQLSGTGKVDLSQSATRILYPEWFGATGDGNSANAAANNAAFAALFGVLRTQPNYARRGTVVMLSGNYILTQNFNVDYLAQVRFEGVASNWASGGAASLTFSGASSTYFLQFGSPHGIEFARIHFQFTNPNFSGDGVKFQILGSGGDSSNGGDPSAIRFTDCTFAVYSTGEDNVRTLLNLDKVIDAQVRDTFFTGGLNGMEGGTTANFNHIVVDGCEFRQQGNAAILNPVGTGLAFNNIALHGSSKNNNGAGGRAIGFVTTAQTPATGLTISNVYMESSSSMAVGQCWMQLKAQGAIISGIQFSPVTANASDFTASHIELREQSHNVTITGNVFLGAVNTAAVRILGSGEGTDPNFLLNNNFTSTTPVYGNGYGMLYLANTGTLVAPLDSLPTRIKAGVCTLVAGICTVSAAYVNYESRILVNRQADVGTIGASYSITRVAGTSFTITAKDASGATQIADTSVVAWQLVQQ